jgi:hypothetical protein
MLVSTGTHLDEPTLWILRTDSGPPGTCWWEHLTALPPVVRPLGYVPSTSAGGETTTEGPYLLTGGMGHNARTAVEVLGLLDSTNQANRPLPLRPELPKEHRATNAKGHKEAEDRPRGTLQMGQV